MLEFVAEHLPEHVPDGFHLQLGGGDDEAQPARFIAELNVADGQVGQLVGQQIPHLDGFLRLVEQRLHRNAAGEVDVEQVLPAIDRHGDRHEDQQDRSADEVAEHAHEVDVRVSDHPEHFDPGDPLPLLGDVEDHPRDEHRGVDAHGHADPESDREALDLVGAEDVQHRSRDQGGQVGVDDRGACPAKGVADRHAQGGPPFKLLAQSLEHQHIVVHGHADRQRQSGEARQGKGRIDRQHHREQDQHVQRQRDVGHDAAEAIVPEHEQRHENRRDDHRVGALLDRVASERRTAVQLADRLFRQRHRQAAGVEHVDQFLNLLLREIAADFTVVGDRAIDPRSGIQLAVENDA